MVVARAHMTTPAPLPNLIGIVVMTSLLLALTMGCIKRQVVSPTPPNGSCDGACAHYMQCKKISDQKTRTACKAECLQAHETDGIQDAETLGTIERLPCEAMIGIVEGESGRVPGQSFGEPR